MEKLKVLVVDDKKIVADVFDFTLGYSGHQVKCVTNPDEAITLVKTQKFDIAFLDLILPTIDGIDLLKKLRKHAPDLPVVMMSGYSSEDKWNRVRELGVVSCLRKPFEFDDVKKAVKETIGKEI
jgi:CheY-like chemotaxis protein